jgi:hypothetical protein
MAPNPATPLQHHYKSGRSMTAERGWKRLFDDPIPLPRARPLPGLLAWGEGRLYAVRLRGVGFARKSEEFGMLAKVARCLVFGAVFAVILWVALLPVVPVPTITPTVYEMTHR